MHKSHIKEALESQPSRVVSMFRSALRKWSGAVSQVPPQRQSMIRGGDVGMDQRLDQIRDGSPVSTHPVNLQKEQPLRCPHAQKHVHTLRPSPSHSLMHSLMQSWLDLQFPDARGTESQTSISVAMVVRRQYLRRREFDCTRGSDPSHSLWPLHD